MKSFIAIFILMMLTLPALAGTTATLLLKGTIPQILDVSVAADAVASTLDLTTPQSNLKVATVTEKSNSSTGYKVTISSQNAGLLKNGSVDQLAYTLTYNNIAINLASPVTQTNSAVAALAVDKDVTISYAGKPAAQLVAGDYTDTITFTIAAN